LICAKFDVELATVLDFQTRRFAHDQSRSPFRENAGLQRRQRVRHLVHQRSREPEVPTSTRWCVVARQRDLTGQPAAALGCRHAGSGLGGSALRVKRGGAAGLVGGGGRLRPLHRCNAFHESRLV
jgi:hypothetical protein